MLNYNPKNIVKYYVIVKIKMRTMRKCEISSPEQRPSSMLQMLCELFLFPFRYTTGTTCTGQNMHTCIMPGTFLFYRILLQLFTSEILRIQNNENSNASYHEKMHFINLFDGFNLAVT